MKTSASSAASKRADTLLSRRLFYIPIIHDEADMGALSEAVKQIAIEKLGPEGWEQRADLIDAFWKNIETSIEDWSLAYSKVRLYQDGLPVCGREFDIVRDLAESGSRNHQLLLRLKARGAVIMGTESSALLVEEYKFLKETLNPDGKKGGVKNTKPNEDLSRSLLERRDQAIAERINTSLQPGETGLLFLGMLHSVQNLLDEDIEVDFPLTKPTCPNTTPCEKNQAKF